MKRLLGNLALSVATVVVFLGVLEGAARLLEKPRPERPPVADYIWDWDDQMPGGFYVMKTDAMGWPPWEEFNREGLRDRTRTREKPEGWRRIVVLGDSVTLGAEIKPEEAFPQRLEARYRDEGRPVEVLNVALWGWSTRQQRIAWERIARHYDPDEVVLAVCLNDVPELQNNLSRPPRWLTRLHERSALVRLLVDAQGREIDNVERLFQEPDAPRVREALDRFFDEVRTLRQEVEDSGAALAVVYFPFRFQVEEGAPPPVVQEAIAGFCAAEGLACLDLLPAIAGMGPSAFVDYDHLSPAGAALVAETLAGSGLLHPGEPARDVLDGALGERKEDVSALAGALEHHPSEAVRLACAETLGARPAEDREAVAALFGGLADPREAVRAAAARALARMSLSREDVPVLAAALDSSDPYVVAFAAWTLGNLGAAAEGAVPDLTRVLARDDTEAVVAAALARIGPAAAAAVPALVEALASESADRRWRAARTLGRIGPSAAPAVPALVACLGDLNPAVRQHAARALGRIGPAAREAASALQRATGDGDEQVRSEAQQALDRLH